LESETSNFIVTFVFILKHEHLPKTKVGVQKSYWSSTLSELKQKSIECTQFWKISGSPSSGPVYNCKKSCHYAYKSAIRRAQREDKEKMNEHLYDDLVTRDSNSFWKKWRNLNHVTSNLVTRIDGVTDEINVANAFGNFFKNVYVQNDLNAHARMKRNFDTIFPDYYRLHVNNSIANCYLTWSDMLDIVGRLKTGKATAGFIKQEHIIYGSTELIAHMHISFNGMLQHGFVPTDFLKGIISPIVKDPQGDMSSS